MVSGSHVKTVLVVEDEPLIRWDAAQRLRSAGFHVVEANSADEALAVLTASISVDLVFTDVQMPGSMDGLALVQWICATLPSLPVFVTSGSHEALQQAKSLGVQHLFAKPYDFGGLENRIRSVLAIEPLRARAWRHPNL